MARDLSRLLRPRSIAVIGGRMAENAILQCDKMGFEGPVWPVNPTRASLGGRPCIARIEDLPGAPDAVFIGINRYHTIEAVRVLAERGAGGAICYASGFREAERETGEGGGLQAQLVETAGAMPIIGPNCYGFINALDGALLWPDQHGAQPVERGVAVLTQSSNLAINITMQRRALPVAYVVTAGNQAQTGLSEIASGLIEDDRVTALALHVEGFDDVKAFEALLARARRRGVPVVVMKMGRSEAARSLAVSHTASLSGSDALADTLIKRMGAVRVHSLPDMLETLKLLHVLGPLAGRDICSISCSGGEAALMADTALDLDLNFRPLTDDQRQAVKATLNDIVAVGNPLDYHTFIWGDETRLTSTFSAMLGAGFDLGMLVLDFPRPDRCGDEEWDTAAEAIVKASRRNGSKAAIVSTLPENIPEEQASKLAARGIAPMMGIPEALRAAEAASFVGTAPDLPAPLLSPYTLPGHARMLDEAAAKRLLADHGLAIPEGRLVTTVDETVTAAEAIGYPVVVKAVGEIAHKTEIGGVRLDLRGAEEVTEAAAALAPLGDGLLVERMVTGGVAELIIGISRDAQFGLHLMVGAGGTEVELWRDTAALLLPATRDEIRAAILGLRSAPLITGWRGGAAGDLEACIDAAHAAARFAEAHADTLIELDINPLIVRAEGAIAADALVSMIEEDME